MLSSILAEITNMVRSYNGDYIRLSIGRYGFNSRTDRQLILIVQWQNNGSSPVDPPSDYISGIGVMAKHISLPN